MLPTTVTVLSMVRSFGVATASGRGGGPGAGRGQAAASGFGVGQADQLVADDVVRETERALEVVERPGLGNEIEDGVVALGLVVDLVGEAPLAPPVGAAVHLAAPGGDLVGDGLGPRLGDRLVELAVEDQHQFVGPHGRATSLRTRRHTG